MGLKLEKSNGIFKKILLSVPKWFHCGDTHPANYKPRSDSKSNCVLIALSEIKTTQDQAL